MVLILFSKAVIHRLHADWVLQSLICAVNEDLPLEIEKIIFNGQHSCRPVLLAYFEEDARDKQ